MTTKWWPPDAAVMLFTNTYEHTIDSKNRLSIPADIRMDLDRQRDGTRFYITPGRRPGTLSLYTERRFEELSEAWPDDLLLQEDEYTHCWLFFSMAKPLELDKQGRVLLPEWLLEKTGIRGEVVLTGCRDHLDILKKEDYEATFAENWERYAEVQARAREALRQQRAERIERPAAGPAP